MVGLRKIAATVFMMFFVVVGCSLHDKILPLHDEVLIYKLPYDLTYLRSFEALETFDDWEILGTVKEKGLIHVRNVAYGSFGDADKREVTFLIQRIDREQTSVQLVPSSQRVPGGGLLLERISEYLSRELK